MTKSTKIIFIILTIGLVFFGFYKIPKKPSDTFDPKKIVSEISKQGSILPGSNLNVTTEYFGNEVIGDLNKDGKDDMAFLFTQKDENNIYYYLMVILDIKESQINSKPMLIDKNIAPQNTSIQDGLVLVNYATSNSSSTTENNSSVGKTLRVKLDAQTMELGEVVQNFEGEADPKIMNLQMKTWSWAGNDRFSISFTKDNFSATTDCNGIGGEYDLNGNKISFKNMMSTLMYCEGSQENEFRQMLEKVKSYEFTSKGEMILDLGDGSMFFR